MEKNGYDVIPADVFPKKYVLDYLNSILLKLSAKTHNNHKVVISSLFDVLKKNEMIPHNYLREIDNQKTDSKRHKSGVTTFGWTQKLSPHALSLRHEKQEKELQFRV